MRPEYECYQIKSFKHNGHIHRIWFENWLVPSRLLLPEHAAEHMIVLINEQTLIEEANGNKWTSKVPGVSFFIPGKWYNVVALLGAEGIRFYCNVASPPYLSTNSRVITYIDYDLDVIRTAEGEVMVVDQDEYDSHKKRYHYSNVVQAKVKKGLEGLLARAHNQEPPFKEHSVLHYYHEWKSITG